MSVGELVGRRFGPQLVERLVDPLLGGVYAGRADGLSLRATMPALVAAAARASGAGPGGAGGRGGGGRRRPVRSSPRSKAGWAGCRGGGPGQRRDDPDRAPDPRDRRTVGGWQLTIGSAPDPELLDADAVVLAVPAGAAARLLAGVAPRRPPSSAHRVRDHRARHAGAARRRAARPAAARWSRPLAGRPIKAVTYRRRSGAHRAGRRHRRAGLGRPVRRGGRAAARRRPSWPAGAAPSWAPCSAGRCPCRGRPR